MPRISVPEIGDASLFKVALETYAPKIGQAAMAYSLAVYQNTKLSLREMEAARFRTAQINGCQVCQRFRAGRDLAAVIEDGSGTVRSTEARGPVPDEAFYNSIQHWSDSPLYSPRERLAVELAERMGEAPHSMEGNEAFWTKMHGHFGDAEIMDIALAIGSWMALGRIAHTLELDNVCMATFDLEAA
jgi:alkylhydroperoxidase family enzyme